MVTQTAFIDSAWRVADPSLPHFLAHDLGFGHQGGSGGDGWELGGVVGKISSGCDMQRVNCIRANT